MENEERVWRLRGGSYHSVLEYLLGTTGMTEAELKKPPRTAPDTIENIPAAAELLLRCLGEKMPVVIIGDYDADGITSTAILVWLLREYGVAARTILPRRFTDGYGVSERLVEGIEKSLIICVDNGIAAPGPILKAKNAGNRVIILDHHLPQETIPAADVIVDPHVNPEKSAYVDYCGAGLALKLAEQLLPDLSAHQRLFYTINALACIGTIADVVPLTGDNRRIVRDGLKIINHDRARGMMPCGVRKFLESGGIPCDEETVKFRLGPMLNAPGRMYDAGSSSALKALLCDEEEKAALYTGKMDEINESRKRAVSAWTGRYREKVEADAAAQLIYLPGAPEGILGIIAGKMAESLKMPVFIFSDAAEPGVIKGSGRSYGDFDLFALLLPLIPLTTAAGGHAGAAGVSIRFENYKQFRTSALAYAAEHALPPEEDVLFYDLDVREQDLPALHLELKNLGPFGEGCESPVFRVSGFSPVVRYGSHYSLMGKEKNHLKLWGSEMEAVAFSRAEYYQAIGCPERVDMVGSIGENTWNGKTTLQFNVEALRES